MVRTSLDIKLEELEEDAYFNSQEVKSNLTYNVTFITGQLLEVSSEELSLVVRIDHRYFADSHFQLFLSTYRESIFLLLLLATQVCYLFLSYSTDRGRNQQLIFSSIWVLFYPLLVAKLRQAWLTLSDSSGKTY